MVKVVKGILVSAVNKVNNEMLVLHLLNEQTK
jgi:hypothetical protein